jgi:hypothetical protein
MVLRDRAVRTPTEHKVHGLQTRSWRQIRDQKRRRESPLGRLAARLGAQMYFVWIRGASGPQPQKWSEDCLSGRSERLVHVISKQSISDSDALLSLQDLAETFPPPARDTDQQRYRLTQINQGFRDGGA